MECFTICDLSKIKLRINLKRLIDENSILKNYIIPHNLNEVHFTLDLFSNGGYETVKEYSSFFVPKGLFDENIIFNWFYEDLSSDAKIAISIWSSAKKYNPNKPLGSTVISVFDEHGALRQGKYHLFIWPDVLPDLYDPSTTPGLTNDPNIDTLNFISSKLEECETSHNISSKTEEALKFKLSYTYCLIPAAFLYVEFPKFPFPVFFSDRICPDFNEPSSINYNLQDINQCIQIYDPDFDNHNLNIMEELFYCMKREGEVNPEKVLPNRYDMKTLEAIANRTFRIDLKPSEKYLFAKYRYALTQDKKYLCFYLHSIQLNIDSESYIYNLLSKWQKIDQGDALYLLSKYFAINPIYNKKALISPSIMKIIRNYAISVLVDIKDEDLISILLFLVQSLRYEGEGENDCKSNLFSFLLERAGKNLQVTTLLFWYLKAESETIINPKDSKQTKDMAEQNNLIYVRYLYYLHHKIGEKTYFTKFLYQQIKFIELLRKISKVIKYMKDMALKKQYLRKRLSEVDWNYFGTSVFPMDVSIVLKQPIIPECTLFSSAMAPFRLTFETIDYRKFSFIYKSGDDLRQDQLILELFSLMDRLLKGVNQDYKLTPYKALACSKSDGYVEFVPYTRTFQYTNLKYYLNSLVEYKSMAMNNYVFSCAGYCAITYFFGIGDRHLENLLIDSSGKMFHIDFGFIFGRDPKPYPPPIKIRKDMIEAMGGTESENFKTFKAKCLEAYLYLRKHHKIIYNLVYLMLDSGIRDVHMEGMSKLYDKFSTNMNDKEAYKHFLMVLEYCKNALFAIINDKFHKWAEHFK